MLSNKTEDPGIKKPGSFFDMCSVNTLIDKKNRGLLHFLNINFYVISTMWAN